MPGVRGFERARSSRAGDEGTTTMELDDRADEPRADGVRADGPRADGVQAGRPQEEQSLGDRVQADWAMLLQMEEEDQLNDPPTDRG